jgi:CDP-glycerol glycerophosphotransferase
VTGVSQAEGRLPDVSVVVIGYNDAANLPSAVESVLRQTLRNLEVIIVDDASTDTTGEVADRLAAQDSRVRVIHLSENSGGCSVPRNTGLEVARAPYVMFLDSDDVYERHACKNLLLEAERTGADVVGGQVLRIFLDRDRELRWFPGLFEERATFAGIRENPKLFFDPLSTNKIYRREFLEANGIRFPEGVHYEDSLFSTKVYCMASSIAVIPNLVYNWHVVKDAEEKSITQRRYEFENFRDRIAVHRMMDDFLMSHGSGDLITHKNYKFIRHDLRLYLNDLPHRDYEYQRRFMRLAADYLATISEDTLALVDPVERICVHMIRRLDVEETLKTVDYLRHGYKVSTELVERDGRIYWGEKYLDTPEDRAVMDVTDMGMHRMPFETQSIFNEVRAVRLSGRRLQLTGRLLNQFGQIAPGDKLRLTATVRNRGRRVRRSFPVRDIRHDGNYIHYDTEIDLVRATRPLDELVKIWDLRLDIAWDGRSNFAPFSIDPAMVTGRGIPLRARFGGLVNATVEPYVTINGNLAFEQAPDSGVGAAAGTAHSLAVRARNSARGRARDTLRSPALMRRVFRWSRKLPVKPGVTVFESHMGLQYSDNPKYVYEAARRVGFDKLGITPVWSHAGPSPAGFPSEAASVRRKTWRYYYLLARAQYWVDNQGFPRAVTKRPETTYLQTWHGTPLKTMGWDEPGLAALSGKARRAHERMIERWDYLVAPSEYFVETFVRAYRYDGKLLRVGYPRNDLLVTDAGDAEKVREARERLGLPLDRTIVLYAPTFRQSGRGSDEPYELPFELRDVAAALSDDVFLLVRNHYLDEFKLSRRFWPFARNVSDHDDMTELLLVADVLVTDYSSTMFDFANTGRPMIFYTHDYDDYVHSERGTYFSLADEAPGPLVSSTEELVAALSDLEGVRRDYAERYRTWRQRFCEYDSGHASDDVVAAVFGPGSRP